MEIDIPTPNHSLVPSVAIAALAVTIAGMIPADTAAIGFRRVAANSKVALAT